MNIDPVILAKIQKEKGLSVNALAEAVGMSRFGITKIRRTGSTTTLTARRIARALGVSLEEITEKKGGDGLKTKTEAREWLKRSAIHVGFTDANEEQPQSAEEFRADQTMQNMAERVQFLKLLNADEISWADLYGEYVREYTETAEIIRGLKGSE